MNTMIRRFGQKSSLPSKQMFLSRILPALLIVAILWDWVAHIISSRWGFDAAHFMYFGQRLADGTLPWTTEFDDKLPVNHFLFWLPAKLESFRVWQLMSIGACLLGAYSTCVIARSSFSVKKGFDERVERYAGLYSGIFMLYMLCAMSGAVNHINAFAISMIMTAIVLLKRGHLRTGGGGGNNGNNSIWDELFLREFSCWHKALFGDCCLLDACICINSRANRWYGPGNQILASR